ncbi:hypothetical protein BHM03_00000948 [Ensete ventricosum]|nr:hypothetical protein BHM03_00000948 [Ensete ventricosum]
MGSKEILSQECTSARSPADGRMESVVGRSNLQFHFSHSDERRLGGIDRTFVANGTTPVNLWGKPIDNLSKTGGWIAAFFIFGTRFLPTINDLILLAWPFGAAGIRPCVSSFGADQFDERSKDYKAHLDRFFNFFYLSVTVGAIVAFTMVVYIQMKRGWGSAFASLAIAMAISNVVFFAGTPLYRHRLPGGSPLTRVAQVLVAAFRKRNVPFSSSDSIDLYELPGQNSAIKGSGKIDHTDGFRYLSCILLFFHTMDA